MDCDANEEQITHAFETEARGMTGLTGGMPPQENHS